MEIYDWDSGEYLGNIKNVPNTYRVVCNINEHQLVIGETTFGGIEELSERSKDDIIDYGNLIWLTLQRSKTAREAISTIDWLTKTYGYASSGESFTIADVNEVWIMEIMSKGKEEKGAVWVARKIPDNYVSGHANQARIRTFPLNDPDNCQYSDELLDFVTRHGYYKGEDLSRFSFADTFNPLTFDGARWGEARVWSFFNQINKTIGDKHLDLALGKNINNENMRLPLFIIPEKKISVKDVQFYMRNHYEDTPLDMTKDIGGSPMGNVPYRWRPLSWKSSHTGKVKTYVNERAIATQQTGWSFVSEIRKEYPSFLGKLWFGVDDTGSTAYFPIYSNITRIPTHFSIESGNITQFSYESAFWIFNMVTNFAYTRYNMINPEVMSKIDEKTNEYFQKVSEIESEILEYYTKGSKTIDEMVEILTSFSETLGDDLFSTWKTLYGVLFAKYFDGNRRLMPPKQGHTFPRVEFPGYPQEFYDVIVEQTGKKFLFLEDNVFGPGDLLVFIIIMLIFMFIR